MRFLSPLFPSLLPALAIWLLTGAALGQTSPTLPAENQGLTSPVITCPEDGLSSPALAYLQAIEKRHGKLQTLSVRFEQIRVSEAFADETRSSGHVRVKMPDQVRCDYTDPEPSRILFRDMTFYQYAPTIEQVDVYHYGSQKEAQDFLEMLMLGFGLSTGQVQERYAVRLLDEADAFFTLAFYPKAEKISRDYREIRVRFSKETLLPEKIQLYQVVGDVTTLLVQDLTLDMPLGDDIFELSFPEGVEIIHHGGER